jgi:hypothetical protein
MHEIWGTMKLKLPSQLILFFNDLLVLWDPPLSRSAGELN